MIRLYAMLSLVALLTLLGSPSVPAQTIIDEWSTVKVPPPPELKPVIIDLKTTALLMLDFIKQTCNQERRPRCLTSVPKAKKLLDQARAKDMLVVYSIIPGPATIGDTLPEVAPTAKEPFVKSGVDKFYKTNLEQVLKDKNIQTVITVGTAANGAVMYTPTPAKSEDPPCQTARSGFYRTDDTARLSGHRIAAKPDRVGSGRVGRSSSGPTCERAGVARRWDELRGDCEGPVAGRRHHPHLVSPV